MDLIISSVGCLILTKYGVSDGDIHVTLLHYELKLKTLLVFRLMKSIFDLDFEAETNPYHRQLGYHIYNI